MAENPFVALRPRPSSLGIHCSGPTWAPLCPKTLATPFGQLFCPATADENAQSCTPRLHSSEAKSSDPESLYSRYLRFFRVFGSSLEAQEKSLELPDFARRAAISEGAPRGAPESRNPPPLSVNDDSPRSVPFSPFFPFSLPLPPSLGF